MTRPADLSTIRATALYVGALLGPSLLLLPGLAAALAGPASIVAWMLLLGLSALLARVFTAFGTSMPTSAGVAGYVTAGLGPRAGRAIDWCFLGGVVFGAPVVCLIGGHYVGVLVGGGTTIAVSTGAILLATVLALTLRGIRATTTAQLALVCVLISLVIVAVLWSASKARAANWTPFAPHGWTSVGSSASVLMLSFVGWEAIAPLTRRLRSPRRQLPRIIVTAFLITAIIYLALAFSTVAVLGSGSDSTAALSDLLKVAIGWAGPLVAAVCAVALTLATTSAYLAGAIELAASSRINKPRHGSYRLRLLIGIVGVAVLAAAATGLVSTAQLVAIPTTLFLTVYLGSTAAAIRVFRRGTRLVAAVSCCVVAGVLAFAGWSIIIAALLVFAGARARPRDTHTSPAPIPVV